MCRLCQSWPVVPAIAVVVSLFHAANSSAASPQSLTPLTMEALVRTDRSDLEALYRGANAGTMPVGSLPGRAIPSPGTRKTVRQSKLIGLLWKGKEFPADGVMVNRLALGLKAVRADVYYGESWLDGRPAIVLDYANTSRRFGDARDEMREIAPGLYLGITYVRKCPEPKLAMFYTLQVICNGNR